MEPRRSHPAPLPATAPTAGNGVHGETGEYLHPALSPDEALDLVSKEIFSPRHLEDLRWRSERDRQQHLGPMEGVDPGRLAETGWGIVLPAGLDPRVRKALEPLLDLRRQQAGERYQELVYEGEDKTLFLARYGAGPGPVDPRNVPYYLLLVGGLEEIPFEFQYQIDVQHAVGRLCFDGPRRLEEYARYAGSVVQAETRASQLQPRVTLFAPRTNGDSATERMHDLLVEPLARELTERRPNGPPGWQIDPVLGPAATRERLLELMGRNAREKPALLLTTCHGVGFPSGDPRQIETQGALLCQDWKGPGHASAGCYVSAGDIGDEFVPAGLVTFHFACYSAATPAANSFAHGGPDESKSLAPASFIARLPQRLLSHPGGGALAVVGHVDRAWTYSFDWPLAGEQLQVFASAFLRLLKGYPIGWAMEPFNQRYAELASDVLAPIHRTAFSELLDPVAFRTALLDARNYVILGDPAVRLSASFPFERRHS